MSEKITEIMREIDKFKDAVANTDNLSETLNRNTEEVKNNTQATVNIKSKLDEIFSELIQIKQKATLAVALSGASTLVGIAVLIILLSNN